jgi:hypothetical protein
VDVNRMVQQSLLLEHRHSDGSWERLRPRSHPDQAGSDPERGWQIGRIYVCPSCEETVRVVPSGGDGREG